MRRGRPKSIRLNKRYKRKLFSAALRGSANPKQRAAARARRRRR